MRKKRLAAAAAVLVLAGAAFAWATAETGGGQANAIEECDDIPEVAVISDYPVLPIRSLDPFFLGSTGSSAGVGDTGSISYRWSVENAGAISGPADKPTVEIVPFAHKGRLVVSLTVDDGVCSNAATTSVWLEVRPPHLWLRGDFHGDGELDISDGIASLSYMFTGGAPPGCEESLDFNADRVLDVSDPVALLGYIFLGSASPPPPYPGCDVFSGCRDVCL